MKDQFIKENVDFNRQVNDVHIINLEKNLFTGTIDSIANSLALLKEEHGSNVFIKNLHYTSQDAFSSGHDNYALFKPVPESDKEYQERIDKEQKQAIRIFDENVKSVVNKVLNNKKLTSEEKKLIGYVNQKSKENYLV